MDNKRCTACGIVKHRVRDFKYEADRKKYSSWCYKCKNDYSQAYKKGGLIAARAAVAPPRKKCRTIAEGDTVIASSQRYVVHHVVNFVARKPEVIGHRIMSNGQILRNTNVFLGTNYEKYNRS